MQLYLAQKYNSDFLIQKTSYNPLLEIYQAYAYPKDHKELLFLIQEDPNSNDGYSDTYLKANNKDS